MLRLCKVAIQVGNSVAVNAITNISELLQVKKTTIVLELL